MTYHNAREGTKTGLLSAVACSDTHTSSKNRLHMVPKFQQPKHEMKNYTTKTISLPQPSGVRTGLRLSCSDFARHKLGRPPFFFSFRVSHVRRVQSRRRGFGA
ncbi:hypothetical protein ABW19_dt0207666 [Dactylella cylindrospora]|nr:hypothetical protein ABW19_dt0207666 [Dactylella cylindrospora]